MDGKQVGQHHLGHPPIDVASMHLGTQIEHLDVWPLGLSHCLVLLFVVRDAFLQVRKRLGLAQTLEILGMTNLPRAHARDDIGVGHDALDEHDAGRGGPFGIESLHLLAQLDAAGDGHVTRVEDGNLTVFGLDPLEKVVEGLQRELLAGHRRVRLRSIEEGGGRLR